MVCPSPHDYFEAQFGMLPKEAYELFEELWAYKQKLSCTKGWFQRYKIKSAIKELEKITFPIAIRMAFDEVFNK